MKIFYEIHFNVWGKNYRQLKGFRQYPINPTLTWAREMKISNLKYYQKSIIQPIKLKPKRSMKVYTLVPKSTEFSQSA